MTCGDGEENVSLSKKKSGSREGLLISSKESKKKSREEEKQEKRKAKEEERIRRQNDKKNKKKGVKGSTPGLDDFIQSQSNLIPLFVEKSIAFIEEEGLDSEGIYRVPGNRAHVDLLFQNFEEGKSFKFISSCSHFPRVLSSFCYAPSFGSSFLLILFLSESA
jgi:hypothetical protein